ncbi:DUF6766 family protein [Flavisolibacter tropicus]|uniref:Membrane protein n=1 Tax=Flavisolibacter tropicus TaxID=1492898 RepID=A0A172TZZ3_9BACT|nr:DUF6766 family protein [Flavisolibacter tropicus]ANE52671.1 membrane protein [Flavisolibacter tropicus]
MKKVLRNNSLSLVFFLLFLVSIVGQTITGLRQYNEKMQEKGRQQVGLRQYLSSGHFLESTFENWESEFLQMGLFVVMTIFLYQKGSSESKDPDDPKGEEDREPDPNKEDAPWPVKQGGLILKIYKHSLTIALFLMFAISFGVHWYGSMKDYNEEQQLLRKPTETAIEYLANSRLWFESFQNWQSEFLSVLAIIMLSVFLRQKGSPQSKPVDAAYADETGE